MTKINEYYFRNKPTLTVELLKPRQKIDSSYGPAYKQYHKAHPEKHHPARADLKYHHRTLIIVGHFEPWKL